MSTTTRTAPPPPANPLIVEKASILLRHAAAHHGLKDRIQRAIVLADEYPSSITKGRGYGCDTGHWAYIGGSGDTYFNDFEVARARPHHATSQEQYSITRTAYKDFSEYFCTCADSRTSEMRKGAPYIPGWGTCCKHVLAFLLMRAVGAIEEVTP